MVVAARMRALIVIRFAPFQLNKVGECLFHHFPGRVHSPLANMELQQKNWGKLGIIYKDVKNEY
ncbi:MAG: hypothetical protein CL912_12150 [Deltaproteobacteria bacterium]|nr:hypothetical protein [Deltaproteobacteria bacterium]